METGKLTPGVFAPAPQRASFASMVAAQGRIESKLMLRHGEQLLVNVIIPAAILLAAHFAPILGDNTNFNVLVPMVFAVAATGDPDHFQALARRFLGPEVESVRRLETIGAPRPAAAPVPTRSAAFVRLGAEQEGVT